MASIRIGIASEFNLVDSKVGVGTTNPTELMDVRGQIYSDNSIGAGGISTVTTYQGFLDTKQTIKSSVSEGTVVAGTLSGEIIIDGEVTVSSGTTYRSGVDNLTVTDNFTLPGISDDVPSVGTTRFNENLGALEFYTGVEWRAVNSYVDMGNRNRGVCSGGWSPVPGTTDTMEVFSLTSQGNAIDFGNIGAAGDQSQAGSVSNSIRGVLVGGGPGNDTHMSYYTIASGGDGIDFGNLNAARRRGGGLSSSTRGLAVGGRSPGSINAIDYIEIMTVGNAIDFGDLTTAKNGPSSVSSPTHGIITNGYSEESIDKVTIASKGNAILVGQDMFFGGYSTGGASTGTRGVWAGGYGTGASSPYAGQQTTSIRGVDIASGGNSTEFGNLIYREYCTYICGTGSNTRGFWMGGADEPNSAKAGPHITMVNLKSGGEAENWGDLTQGRSNPTAFSDCHGGLGGI